MVLTEGILYWGVTPKELILYEVGEFARIVAVLYLKGEDTVNDGILFPCGETTWTDEVPYLRGEFTVWVEILGVEEI